MLKHLMALTTLFLLSACSNLPTNDTPFINADIKPSHTQPGELQQRILLLGDAGHSALDPLQASLQKSVERASLAPKKTTVVMLGDNIYYFGFPNKDADQEEYTDSQLEDISHLEAQLQIAKRSGAEIYIVPGNHDWYADQVDSQSEYIEAYASNHNLNAEFAPHQSDAHPLPEIVHRNGISIVFLDSMWMIKAEQEHFQQAMAQLEKLLKESNERYPENVILITAHHPIETMGPHNRYYSSFGYKAMIAIAELFIENDQDTDHPRYQRLISAMEKTIQQYDKVIYAAGHDHNLQIFKDIRNNKTQYRLVSGAANTSKLTGVGSNDNTQFALSQEGLMEVDIVDNGVLLKVYDIYNDQPVHQQWLWQH